MMFMVRNENGDWTKQWRDVLKDFPFLETVEKIDWKHPLGELYVHIYLSLHSPQLRQRLINIAESLDYSDDDIAIPKKQCFLLTDDYVGELDSPDPEIYTSGGSLRLMSNINDLLVDEVKLPLQIGILCQRTKRSVVFIIKECWPKENDPDEDNLYPISKNPRTIEDRTLEEKGGVPACEDFPYPQ